MVQLKKLMVDEEGWFGRAKTKMGALVEERREQCGSDLLYSRQEPHCSRLSPAKPPILVFPQPNHSSSSFSNQTSHHRLSPAKPPILVFLQPNLPSSSFPSQTTHPRLSPAKPLILVFLQPNLPSSSFPSQTTHPRLSPTKPPILVFPQPNHSSSSFQSQTTHPRLSPAKPPIFVFPQPNHPSSSFLSQTTHPCLSPAKPPILVFPQSNHPSSSFPSQTTHPRLSPSHTTHPCLSPAKPPILVWMKAWMTLWVEALDKLMEVHWGIGSRSGKEWWWWRAEVRVGLPTNLLFLPQIAGQILLCPHLSSIPRFFQSYKREGIVPSPAKLNVSPQRCLLAHFEATLDFSRSEFTCP